MLAYIRRYWGLQPPTFAVAQVEAASLITRGCRSRRSWTPWRRWGRRRAAARTPQPRITTEGCYEALESLDEIMKIYWYKVYVVSNLSLNIRDWLTFIISYWFSFRKVVRKAVVLSGAGLSLSHPHKIASSVRPSHLQHGPTSHDLLD